MADYRAKLHFSVVIEIALDADSGLNAEAVIKDYENLILSQNWLADKATDHIKEVRETSYCSSIAIADPPKKSEGLRLG